MSEVVFLDCETISLQRDHRHLWEIGIIFHTEIGWVEKSFMLDDVPLGEADAIALDIGGFHTRYTDLVKRQMVAQFISSITWGKHLVGAVPSFDELRLWDFLKAHGQCPGWHYHLIDVEALAIGYLAGRHYEQVRPPWKSEQLTQALGIIVPEEDKHTALGDARWAKAIYERVME